MGREAYLEIGLAQSANMRSNRARECRDNLSLDAVATLQGAHHSAVTEAVGDLHNTYELSLSTLSQSLQQEEPDPQHLSFCKTGQGGAFTRCPLVHVRRMGLPGEPAIFMTGHRLPQEGKASRQCAHLDDLSCDPLIVALMKPNVSMIEVVFPVCVKAGRDEDEIWLKARQGWQDLVSPSSPPQRDLASCIDEQPFRAVPKALPGQ